MGAKAIKLGSWDKHPQHTASSYLVYFPPFVSQLAFDLVANYHAFYSHLGMNFLNQLQTKNTTSHPGRKL